MRVTTASSRFAVFADEQWARIEPLLPSNAGRRGHPFEDNRRVVEGIVYRYRTGIPWRDLPRGEFGPWQTGQIPANDATPEVVGCGRGWSREAGAGSGDGEA